MKKIIKIWQENKVLLVLAIILLICIIVVVVAGMTFFYGNNNNVYGNRLEAAKDVPISDKLLQDIKSELEKNELVSEVSTELRGLIVYINIHFVKDVKIDDAKKLATSSLELFNDDELEIYDIEYSITNDEDDGFTLMGARNSSGAGEIVWNNYNIETKETTVDTKKKDSAKA